VDSASIITNFVPGNPPSLQLNNIDPTYETIINAFTNQMYNAQGSIPLIVNVPLNKSFLVQLTNNDEVELTLPNDQKLIVNIQTDLALGQTMDMIIKPDKNSTQNKKLDIYMNSNYTGVETQVLLLGNIDLPLSFNEIEEVQNASYLWKDFSFNIDFSGDITLLEDNKMWIPLEENHLLVNNSIKEGDVFKLNNFFVGTSSIYDFSGQYAIDGPIGSTSSIIQIDVSSNSSIISYGASQSLPFYIHRGASYSLLSNKPYFSLNKGKKVKLTRVSDSSILTERYHIEVIDII
jgi:hypothetical protein